MNILKLLFSFKGSISRFEYLAGLGIATLLFAALVTMPAIIVGHGDPSTYNNLSNGMKLLKAALYLTGLIVAFICSLALAAKRLRNLQWSQWFLVVYMIPIANLILMVPLFLKRGQPVTRNYN